MVAAENFVAELDTKNQTSIQRVIDALSAALAKDGVEVADALRFAVKATIESAEVAALWITDCDDLEMKLTLAEQCGDSARQCRRLSERLVALGVAVYDPRDGGYSKLFAFHRSLQTTHESMQHYLGLILAGHPRIEVDYSGHRRVLEACIARDPDRAADELTRHLNVLVHRLRSKLAGSYPYWIETVRGRGYGLLKAREVENGNEWA